MVDMAAANAPSRRGRLISLEGGEGCGKTSALPRLAAALRAAGHLVVETREPGGTPIGMQLRSLLLNGDTPLPPTAELFLMEAARAIHVAQVIRPALAAGALVLTDRFTDSTLVYQGAVRQLDRSFLVWANLIATEGLVPDLTLYLDVEPSIGLARRRHTDTMNHFDQADLAVHETIRQAFHDLAAQAPHRIVTINAERDQDTVLQSLLHAVTTRLELSVEPHSA